MVSSKAYAGSLARGAAEADRAEFDALSRREAQHLFALGVAILGDRSEAEDAVQETLLRAWRHWAQLRDTAARRAWLTRICVNQCLSARRRFLKRLLLPIDDALTASGDEPNPAYLDQARAFRRLTRDQRAVVLLHFGHGYTLDECAEILECAPGTARSRLGRALDTLRQEIGNE